MNTRIPSKLPFIFILLALVFLASSISSFYYLTMFMLPIGFLLLFLVLGMSVRILLGRFFENPSLKGSLSWKGFSWDILLSGLITLFISSFLTLTFHLDLITIIICSLIVILNLITISLDFSSKGSKEDKTDRLFTFRPSYLGVFAVVFAAIIITFYFRSTTPYPSITGWDINNELAITNWIQSTHGYNYLFIPSFPAGGTPYPGLFFHFISGYFTFLGIEPVLFFWVGIFAVIAIYLFLIYLITLKISNNVWLSLTSCFAAFFISAAGSEIVRSPLYITLDMLSLLLLLIIILFNVYNYGDRSLLKKIINLVSISALFVFNYYVLILTLPILIILVILDWRQSFSFLKKRIFKIIGVLTSAVLIVSLLMVAMFVPSISSLLSGELFTLSMKIDLISTIYPSYFWALISLALLSMIIYHVKNRRIPRIYALLLFFIGFYVFLYFLPIWLTYRVEFYLRILLSLLVSGIALLLDIGWFKKTLFARFRTKVKLGVIVSFLILVSTIVLMLPLFTEYQYSSYISRDEHDAAIWLRENTPQNSYIITDPSSGYVIRGISLRNSSSYFILPDGRMPADSFSLYPNIIYMTERVFSDPSSFNYAELSDHLKVNDLFVVVTSRTVYWASSSFSNVVMTHPVENTVFSIDFDPQLFRQVYNSSTVQIYQPIV
jgi:hypothetical protein